MEVLKVIILAVIVLGIGMIGMAIRLFFLKGGKFVNTHVGGNKHLKSQGIHCAQTQDKIEQRKAWRKVKFEKLKFASDIKTGE